MAGFAATAGEVAVLLAEAEAAIEAWLQAHDRVPTQASVEGYRLLALHRQAARGDASFNACRETCRELIYQCNVALAAEDAAEQAHRLRLAAMVGTHLGLFVAGKLETAGLGTFCCASRPLRAGDAAEAPFGSALAEGRN